MTSRRLLITSLTLCFAIAIAGVSGDITQPPAVGAAPWPTPPPGPSSPSITVIPNAQITHIPLPSQLGSITTVVHPIQPGLMRVPPVASTIIRSAEPDPGNQIELHIEAGTIPVTFQLMYKAMDSSTVPPVPNDWQVFKAFRLKTFSFTGQPANFELLRPVLLRLSAGAQYVTHADNEDSHLLIARFDEVKQTWVPLVTTVNQSTIVEARLLQMGLIALVSEPAPVSIS